MKRQGKPWVEAPVTDRHEVPYENRFWYICSTSGRFIQCDHVWDRASKTAMQKSWPEGQQGPISFDELNEILDECMVDDCTIIEAFIRARGEDNLPKNWIEDALAAPGARFTEAEGVEPEPEPESEPEPAPKKRRRRKKLAENTEAI